MARKKNAGGKKKLPPGVRERNGRYTFRYSVPVVKGGKQTRKQKETESFATVQEAYDAGILIKANKLQGKPIDPKNLTLGQWRDRWLEDYDVERDPAEYTKKGRRTGINSLCNHFGEHTLIKSIDNYEYQGWLNKLKRDGKKRGTITEYHASAKLMFDSAHRKEVILQNPTVGAKVPLIKKTLQEIESGGSDLPKYLEKKQLKHLLNIIRFRGHPQEYELFTILAFTGLRIGELLALKTTDFNELERTLSITKNLTVLSSLRSYSLGPPKNLSSVRTITIGDTVIKAIKDQLAWREQMRHDFELPHDADFLFWSHKYLGYPKSPITVGYRFAKLIKLADLSESITPHSLRHTYVSLSAEAGEDLAVIQAMLGHKNDRITQTVYMHVTEKKRKAAPARFENYMNSI